jgi:hypothetical protein
MIFVDHNHVVEKLAACATYDALNRSVLPRALECGSSWINTEALDCVRYGR